jgi:hypothetical protein
MNQTLGKGLRYPLVCLRGVMISMPAIRPKFCRFKPARHDGIFMGDKNQQHIFLLRGSKTTGPKPSDFKTCKKSLASMNKNYFASQNSSFPLPEPPACYQITLLVVLPESSGGRIKTFPVSTSFHHGSPCSYITWGMNNRPAGSHSSET